MALLIIGIVISLLFSAFFSGMEIAFVSSNRMLAEIDKDKNGLSQKCLSFFYDHSNNFVSTMLVGNNISLVVYGILIAGFFDQTIFQGCSAAFTVPADTVLSTLIVLFTGEFLPKTLFKRNPNVLITFFAVPTFLIYILLWPISQFSTFLSNVFMRTAGVKIKKDGADEEFSKVDLDYLVQSSIDNAENEGDIDSEVKIFQNALDLSDTRVRDCMVPRTEIDSVSLTTSASDLRQRFIESGHSKIIVYKEDIDHIIGYIHSYDLFTSSNNWQSSVRSLPFVPETMNVQKLMQTFLKQKKSIGVVVDEFGGTSGIVALEDIVEEIFGEIEDEHDSTNYTCWKISNNEFMLSARLEIDYLNENYSLGLPESDDYMTIGGLILHHYRSFPKLNEVVTIGKFSFKTLRKTNTKIELVKLTLLEDNEKH